MDGPVLQRAGRRGDPAVLGCAAARRVHLRRGRGGRHVSQAGHPLGGRMRRGAPAPRPRSEGPLPVVRRARGDRAGPRARRDDPGDRSAPGPGAVDGLARTAAQRRPLAAATGRRPRTRSRTSARAGPSRPSSRPTSRCAQIVQDDLKRRFSPEQIAGRLRRRFPDDPEMWVSDRDDLSVALRAVARGAQARADPVSAHRPGAAQARPPGRPAQEPHPRHGQHRRAPARGRRPPRARATGRATC